jgi:hypothetical protein
MRIINGHIFVGSPSKKPLASIIKNCTFKNVLYAITFDCDTVPQIYNIINFNLAISSTTRQHTAVVIITQMIDLGLMVLE